MEKVIYIGIESKAYLNNNLKNNITGLDMFWKYGMKSGLKLF